MKRTFHDIRMTKTRLSAGSAFGLFPSALERQRGRFMREGEHAPAPPAAAPEAPAAPAPEAAAPEAAPEGSLISEIAGEAAPKAAEGEAPKPEGEKPAEPEKKEGEEAASILGAPEAYDIKLPAEFTEAGGVFDKEAFDLVEPILREMNLSNEAAEKLMGSYATQVIPLIQKRAADAMDASSAAMRTAWEKQSKDDPDIGGAKFEETKALTKQTLVRFGLEKDGPFLKLLDESGLGNHPDMLRVMSNIGRMTGEAQVDVGGGKGEPARLADRVYGKPTPRE